MADRERLQWVGRLEYLFAEIGYTVGVGNVWRFPYRCYIHGGGAFLLPYFLTVLLCTSPMLFLETFLGQFSSDGPISVWRFCPLLKGVGWAIVFNIFVTNIYYIMFVAYSLYYMLVTFVNIGGELPWGNCHSESWSTDKCRADPYPDFSSMSPTDKTRTLLEMMDTKCVEEIQLVKNLSNVNVQDFDLLKSEFAECEIKYRAPEDEYWNRFVLGVHESDGLDNLGSVVGRNAALLLVCWLIVFYCCVRGIRSIAKVAYVTVTFPVVLLLILLVLGTTLKGHEDGILFYTQPDWSKLSDMSIWSSAATQAMYSLGVVYGSHLTLASYNKFHNNLSRDVIVVVLTNTFTSIFAGFIVFAFIGHASYRLNKPIEDLLNEQGPSILFVSYIQGISQLPGSAVWGFLFFLMVLTLAVDSIFVMVWTVHRAVADVYPKLRKKWNTFSLAAMCFVSFLLGLPLVTKGGIHMIVLLDRYTADFSLTLFLLLESIAVCWLYGATTFLDDIDMMLGRTSRVLRWYLRITWSVTSPAFCVFIFLASAIGYGKPAYGETETPPFGEAIGWLIILSPIVIIILFGIYQVFKSGKPTKDFSVLREMIREQTIPADDWGPRLEEHRTGRYLPDMYITPVDDTQNGVPFELHHTNQFV